VSQLRERSRESVASSAIAIQESGEIHVADAALPTSLQFLGELRLLAGKPAEAITLLKKAIEKGGDRPSYFKSLGWALLASGKEVEAHQPFMTALGENPLDTADLDQLAAAYFLDRINADEFVRLATPKGVYGESFARFYIGQRHWWRGEQEAARDQYLKALDAAKKSNASSIVINWAGACLNKMEREGQQSREK
jgi:tetratricopeptide (TPR) repeat protein